MTRFIPLILALLLSACASPRAPEAGVSGAEPPDPAITPLTVEQERDVR